MKQSSVKKNIFYQMLYEVFAICLPLITSPYVSRVLGAENIGLYSYTFSIAKYFGFFCALGVKNHGNREMAKNRGNKELASRTFTNVYTVQFIMSVIVILVYLEYVLWMSEYKLLCLIQLLSVLSYMFDINWAFFGLELFKQTSTRNIFIKTITFVATFVFVRQPGDLWKYCLILAGGTFLGNAILWIYLPQYIRITKPEWGEVRKNIKPMLLMFIPVISTSVFEFLDKIMVGSMSTKTQLGYYENSEKILYCARTAIFSIGTVMMPRMSALVAEKDKKKTERYMKLSIQLTMCLAFAFSFGVAAVAQDFAEIYWGREFSPCGSLLVGLVVTLPISAFGNFIRMQHMIPNDMDKQYIIATIISAVFNVTINAVFVPGWGAQGAVWGTIVAEGTLCVVQAICVRKVLRVSMFVWKSVPFCIMGAVMFTVVYATKRLLNGGVESLIIEILLGALVYIGQVIGYLFFADKELVLGFFRKKESK